MKKKEVEQRYYNGIQVDSDEETYVIMFLEELYQKGYIKSIQRSQPFTLAEALVNVYTEEVQLKKSVKQVEKRQVLFNDVKYTPEFLVKFTPEGSKLFVDLFLIPPKKMEKLFIGRDWSDGSADVYIEVKGDWIDQNVKRSMQDRRKWLMSTQGVFINVVQPVILFEKTFTPTAYLKTKTGKPRVVHHTLKTLEEYLQTIKLNEQ